MAKNIVKMRRSKERSESGVYHIVLREINRQDIFYDDGDYQRLLETIDLKRENEDKCLEDEAKHRKTDGEVKTEIEKLMSGEPMGSFKAWKR